MTSIVIISHSEDIAKGVKDLLNKMTNGVSVVAYGGVNGEIGTSYDDIEQLINHLDDDALCFYDLGSSDMNIDLAIDMLKGMYHIHKVNAPIVEGSFTAAMSLAIGKTANEAMQEVNKT